MMVRSGPVQSISVVVLRGIATRGDWCAILACSKLEAISGEAVCMYVCTTPFVR
jgi:hypothetical protein